MGFSKQSHLDAFWDRLEPEFESIFRNFHRLYGWRWDFGIRLEAFVEAMGAAAAARRKRHRRRIDATPNAWLNDPVTIWGQTYVDRFTGTFGRLVDSVDHLHSIGVTHIHLMPPYLTPTHNDGGYAVSDYRRTDPSLGTMSDLRAAIDALAEAGLGVVLDVVANHTASDHPWAVAAANGDTRYRDFYFFFEDRTVPDRHAALLRSVFPERPGDAFTFDERVGAWVWTTFHEYQWDLDYRNPDVLISMAGEIGFLANLGVAAIRLDATPFLWKMEGTACENLAEAHVVVEVLSSFTRVVAPGVPLLSEAIVHPDDVTRFVRPEECRMGYNPLVMASLWETLATRNVALIEEALTRRVRLPDGCQWLTYLRSHDDIGWGFADEDARSHGIDPGAHRAFLNRFYSGESDGSFASGLRFQENRETGDARISGTLASLAGLTSAVESADTRAVDLAVRRIVAMYTVMFTCVGIPLVYLGDEIAQGNDTGYLADPTRAGDNRWTHRPPFDWARLRDAEAGSGPEGRVLAAVQRLASRRGASPAFRSTTPNLLESGHDAVLAYRRSAGGVSVTVAVNFSEHDAVTQIRRAGVDWFGSMDDDGPVTLEPYGVRVWERPVEHPPIEPGQVG